MQQLARSKSAQITKSAQCCPNRQITSDLGQGQITKSKSWSGVKRSDSIMLVCVQFQTGHPDTTGHSGHYRTQNGHSGHTTGHSGYFVPRLRRCSGSSPPQSSLSLSLCSFHLHLLPLASLCRSSSLSSSLHIETSTSGRRAVGCLHLIFST